MNVYANYVRTIPLDINLKSLYESCSMVNILLNEKFYGFEATYTNGDNAPLSTAVFKQYNFLLFPLPGVHELYEAIRHNFREISGKTGPHFIGCWLNYYTEDGYLGWHRHWQVEANAWHGYFCVNAEPSQTSYRFGTSEEIHIQNKNNTLVLSPSGLDEHRTYPWPYKDTPRITIAFDIVPQDWLGLEMPNHWIPI